MVGSLRRWKMKILRNMHPENIAFLFDGRACKNLYHRTPLAKYSKCSPFWGGSRAYYDTNGIPNLGRVGHIYYPVPSPFWGIPFPNLGSTKFQEFLGDLVEHLKQTGSPLQISSRLGIYRELRPDISDALKRATSISIYNGI